MCSVPVVPRARTTIVLLPEPELLELLLLELLLLELLELPPCEVQVSIPIQLSLFSQPQPLVWLLHIGYGVPYQLQTWPPPELLDELLEELLDELPPASVCPLLVHSVGPTQL